jgi:hypothetical protein
VFVDEYRSFWCVSHKQQVLAWSSWLLMMACHVFQGDLEGGDIHDPAHRNRVFPSDQGGGTGHDHHDAYDHLFFDDYSHHASATYDKYQQRNWHDEQYRQVMDAGVTTWRVSDAQCCSVFCLVLEHLFCVVYMLLTFFCDCVLIRATIRLMIALCMWTPMCCPPQ